jgi:transcriptional regulator GlxA family with amidase domain
MIDHGDVVTAGGVMAWLDLGLKLVHRYLGSAVMLATARYFLIDPSGREQRTYASFEPSLAHGDQEVALVQRWLQNANSEKHTTSAMARIAGLGQRTFLRRFQKATGMNPGGYVQKLKVEKARDHLETSKLTVKEIAWQVGYDDVSSFSKVFRRHTGLSPTPYRSRFGIESRQGM